MSLYEQMTKVNFPPVTRAEFDHYYEKKMGETVIADIGLQLLITEILEHNVTDAHKKLEVSQAIVGKFDTIYPLIKNDAAISPHIIEPFEKALVQMARPKSSGFEDMRKAAGIRSGLDRLERIKEMRSELNLEPAEQRLVAVLLAAHELNLHHDRYSTKYTCIQRTANDADRNMH